MKFSDTSILRDHGKRGEPLQIILFADGSDLTNYRPVKASHSLTIGLTSFVNSQIPENLETSKSLGLCIVIGFSLSSTKRVAF
jgi:hypothetical protein